MYVGDFFCITLASPLEDWNYYKITLTTQRIHTQKSVDPQKEKKHWSSREHSSHRVCPCSSHVCGTPNRQKAGLGHMPLWPHSIHSFIHPASIYWAPTMCKGSDMNHTHHPCPCGANVHWGGGRQKRMWKPLSCAWPLALTRYSDPEGRYWCLNHLCSPGL